ncbi:MAG: hypothetical protein K2X47_11790 [Bdellovibrionales bacterium]|nr:hypothetical protein [Bdellovibrionales bacterium]
MKKIFLGIAGLALMSACNGGGTVAVVDGGSAGPISVPVSNGVELNQQIIGKADIKAAAASSSYSSPSGWSHARIASEFVNRINEELGDLYMLDLVKANTLQYDYIVVYDYDYQSYDAYYIGDWYPGMDLLNYLWDYESYFYYDLIPVGGHKFQDPLSGILFEKQSATGKNLAKLKAAREAITVKKQSEKLVAKYGLSEDKAQEAARFAYKMKNSAAGTYKISDYDAFAKEFVGSSVSEFQADWKDGNVMSMASRIQKASEMTGMGMEGMNKLISDMFIQK